MNAFCMHAFIKFNDINFVKSNAAVLCRLYLGVTTVTGYPDEGFSLRYNFSEQNIDV